MDDSFVDRCALPLTWLQRFRYHRRHLAWTMYLAALSAHLFYACCCTSVCPNDKTTKTINSPINDGQWLQYQILQLQWDDYKQSITVLTQPLRCSSCEIYVWLRVTTKSPKSRLETHQPAIHKQQQQHHHSCLANRKLATCDTDN